MKLADGFLDIPQEKLHFVYGVNCFQHAIGYSTPIAASQTGSEGSFSLYYMKLTPGNFSSVEVFARIIKNQYKDLILEGCTVENLISCGNRAVVRDGYRTLALYFHKTFDDFHFAFLNDQGKWEAKLIFELPREYETVQAAGGNDYTFHSFLLAPNDLMPSAIAEWVPKRVTVKSSSHADCLDVIDFDKAWSNGSFTLLESRKGQEHFYMPQSRLYFPRAAWPPFDPNAREGRPTTPTQG